MNVNRREFFEEVKEGVMGFFKEFSRPLIVDKIDSVETVMDKAVGVHWYTLEKMPTSSIFDTITIGKKIVFLLDNLGKTKAISSCCSTCGGLIHYSSFEQKLICFQCDTFLSLKEQTGTLEYIIYPIKKIEDGSFIIGMKE